MEKFPVVNVGGSIEEALKGNYSLDVRAILEEAWQLTNKSRVSIVLGLLISFGIGILATMIVSQSLGGIETVTNDPQLFFLVNIVITLIVWPFLAGVEMMGVLHSIGVKTQPKLVFAFLKRGSWVALCAVMVSMLISLGLQLLIIPGIFLAVSLSLTIPLVVEKKLSPGKAIVLCIKATRFQWFKIFSLYLVLLGVLLLALFPIALLAKTSVGILGVMLFLFIFTYLAPMYYNVKGIVYREIFGLQFQAVEGNTPVNDDIFTA